MGLLSWLKSYGSAEGTLRLLMSAYEQSKASGASDEEARLAMLLRRSGWKRLPKPFLLDLVRRLKTPGNIYTFVLFAEDYGILKNSVRKLAEAGNSCARLAVTFTSLGAQLGNQARGVEAESALLLALKLDPEHFPAMMALGALYYLQKMYTVAIPYFEKGLNLARPFVEEMRQDEGIAELAAVGIHPPDMEMAEIEKMYKECCNYARRGPV